MLPLPEPAGWEPDHPLQRPPPPNRPARTAPRYPSPPPPLKSLVAGPSAGRGRTRLRSGRQPTRAQAVGLSGGTLSGHASTFSSGQERYLLCTPGPLPSVWFPNPPTPLVNSAPPHLRPAMSRSQPPAGPWNISPMTSFPGRCFPLPTSPYFLLPSGAGPSHCLVQYRRGEPGAGPSSNPGEPTPGRLSPSSFSASCGAVGVNPDVTHGWEHRHHVALSCQRLPSSGHEHTLGNARCRRTAAWRARPRRPCLETRILDVVVPADFAANHDQCRR